ncbi:type II secretion system protein GspL [Allopusillimonas ginsengisoli]|uniref:type II secretion system protein GspL n=1 Tax=Allopusillimonas ginsengisoli TaxID=453575 RepID=UPI00101FBC00|nr:type II secretion system protein GspL [Allopusillimonas ginsengisoli]TEA80024.1 general secretion pathway protein GspL [Allopusillimonas ginsengisoli]
MKGHLRLSLPPLAEVTPQSITAFAVLDRTGRVLRSGELSLAQLADAAAGYPVYAILHPHDAIVVNTVLPPLTAKRLHDAVQNSVEPMALEDIADLCIAHGPRAPDGNVCIAWTNRRALLAAWQQLAHAKLQIVAFVPSALALPNNDPHPDQALALPVDERWQARLPNWSLAQPEWRPITKTHHWRSAAIWAGAAALLWLLGLNLHAGRLRSEARTLQTDMVQSLRTAFPSIGIIIDPLKQAQNQRDMLRLGSGTAGGDDFMPLALGAARVLDFAEGHIASLHYEDGILTLVLAQGYTPPSNEAALQQAAATQSLTLKKDDEAAHTWHIRRAGVQELREARP